MRPRFRAVLLESGDIQGRSTRIPLLADESHIKYIRTYYLKVEVAYYAARLPGKRAYKLDVLLGKLLWHILKTAEHHSVFIAYYISDVTPRKKYNKVSSDTLMNYLNYPSTPDCILMRCSVSSTLLMVSVQIYWILRALCYVNWTVSGRRTHNALINILLCYYLTILKQRFSKGVSRRLWLFGVETNERLKERINAFTLLFFC